MSDSQRAATLSGMSSTQRDAALAAMLPGAPSPNPPYHPACTPTAQGPNPNPQPTSSGERASATKALTALGRADALTLLSPVERQAALRALPAEERAAALAAMGEERRVRAEETRRNHAAQGLLRIMWSQESSACAAFTHVHIRMRLYVQYYLCMVMCI